MEKGSFAAKGVDLAMSEMQQGHGIELVDLLRLWQDEGELATR
jgi:hypothetical protein